MAVHKALADDGLDAGAATIHFHLSQRYETPPSVSTIFRVLKARGFVALEPHKRPKSSFKRFVAKLPNETWQADMTHVELEGGVVYEVLNMIDDHSRLCVASRAMKTVKATDVVRVLHKAAENWGYPASFLSDNGLILRPGATTKSPGRPNKSSRTGHRGEALRPYHPQTCGKVERFHQTMKKFLAAQDITSPKQLQRQLDRFVSYYNEERPHRGIGRKTPASVYAATEKAMPSPSFVKVGDRRLRFDRVDKAGRVTLRRRGRLHHIGVGRPYAGWRVAMLISDLDIEIVGVDGSPLRDWSSIRPRTTSASREQRPRSRLS